MTLPGTSFQEGSHGSHPPSLVLRYNAYVKGRRVTLLTGDETPENAKLAVRRLKQVLQGSKGDGPAHLRVVALRRHKTAKKTKKPRVIPLDPVVVKLLIFLRRLGQPGEHVFLTHRKTPWHRVSLAQRLKRTREAAGVPDDAKLYGLRHRFAVQAIVHGVDLKTLAELMGHQSTRTTEHYLAAFSDQRQHLAKAMFRANGHSTPPSAAPRPAS